MTPDRSLPTAPAESLPLEDTVTEVEVAEFVGQLMQFWGFKKVMGRLWTILFLSPEPLTGASLARTLSLSSGAVSMGISQLENWNCIERVRKTGDRHEYYVAERDIWKLVQNVLSKRELTMINDFGASLDRASEHLNPSAGPAPSQELPGDVDPVAFKRKRIAQLQELVRVGRLLLSALLDGGSIDPSRLFSIPSATTPTPEATRELPATSTPEANGPSPR